MTAGPPRGESTPPLPTSIWVVAWASLAGQGVQLVWQGLRDANEVSILVSVLLGALVVGYVSAGVVRARTVRLALAWVVLVLVLVFELVGLFLSSDLEQALWSVLSLATTAAALAGLAAFRGTDWYAWQRRRPPAHEGASIGGLVAVAVLVGALGGITAQTDDEADLQVRVSAR